MALVVGMLDINPAVAPNLEAVITATSAGARTEEPGCLMHQLAADRARPGRFAVLECYADGRGAKEHMRAPHLRKLWASGPGRSNSDPALRGRRHGAPRLNASKPRWSTFAPVTPTGLKPGAPGVAEISRVSVAAPRRAEFERLCAELWGGVAAAEPGCVWFSAGREVGGARRTAPEADGAPARYAVVSLFTDAAAMERHARTAHYKAYEARAAPLLAAPPARVVMECCASPAGSAPSAAGVAKRELRLPAAAARL